MRFEFRELCCGEKVLSIVLIREKVLEELGELLTALLGVGFVLGFD